ncbi:serine/threonine protein kinase [Salininema proteolyticum]|uniref:Serine/threonine protein kinase n=1 Tax=Salininema proteolyticum TaxID=1607685 RepID=A0ABV8U268_9ACTN
MTIQPPTQSSDLNLVCGPVDPMQGSDESYRITRLLGSGGQADVYQAVRMSGGIQSAPVSVKVFRLNPEIDPQQQYKSWDKGDAVLMDLHSRGVSNICRRIDAFYGHRPHQPGAPLHGEQVPYQVLEYLPGHDLKDYLAQRVGRVDGPSVLHSVAGVLRDLHEPGGAHPILHMDIKPGNIIVGPDRSAKIIDFTGARYHSPSHLTTISYTRETAGPEAYEGRVGPSYDVHGFGSIAFYLITGATARTDSQDAIFPGSAPATPWARLRQHPYLESNPQLRDHLNAPLADRPADRPTTAELPRWIAELAEMVNRSRVPDLGVDWRGGPEKTPHMGVPMGAATTMNRPGGAMGAAGMAGAAGAGAAAMGGGHAAGQGAAVYGSANAAAPYGAHPSPPEATKVNPAALPPLQLDNERERPHGRVQVPEGQPGQGREPGPQQPDHRQGPSPQQMDQGREQAPRERDEREEHPLLGPPGSMRRGMEFTVIGTIFAAIMWLLWILDGDSAVEQGAVFFVMAFTVALGLFFLLRTLGGIFWGRMMGANRRTARLAHLASGGFMVAVGIGWLQQVSWGFLDFGWLPF